MEKQKNLSNFRDFIGVFDRTIKTIDIKQIHRLLPLIDNFEEQFLNKYQKRKKEGTFYTNKNISDFIVTETLICLINMKLDIQTYNIKSINTLEELSDLEENLKHKIIQLLLRVTICDPACGSGGFLLSAANIIYDILSRLKHQHSDIQIKTQILENLFGFDINELAIKLCTLKLLKWYNIQQNAEIPSVISILNSNLKIQNSIFNSKFPKFDIIIGNPPYGNILNQKEKEVLRNEDIFFKDIYCTFILKALKWSKEVIGFLVPKSFLLRQGYIKFRSELLSKANILKIYDIGSKIFKRATNEVQIVILENKKLNRINSSLIVYDYPKTMVTAYPNQTVDSLRICFNQHCPLSLNSKKLYVYTFKKSCPYCGLDTFKLNRIRIKPNEEIFQIINKIEKIGNLNYLNPVDFPKMIRGEEEKGLEIVKKQVRRDIHGSCIFLSARNDFNYYSFYRNKSLNIEEIDSLKLKGNNYEYYKNPKLLIKHNNIVPEAIFTEETVCFTSSIYSLLNDDIDELKYLCAVLNSIVIQFYCIYAINNQKDTTINLNQYMIRHLPIVKPDDIIKIKIVKKVDALINSLNLNNNVINSNIYQILKEIDDIIFNLYKISESERHVIISKTKNHSKHFEEIYGI
ncbi:MAG: N-6 DNA methylase [Promethearchaeota archaeon]|nr:MAG: N-6 DNA methylase [Candidatus Lokiarchaeota archaeon]